MTREEWEKKREEMLKNRRRSKFCSTAGDFEIIPPSVDEDKNQAKKQNK